MLKGYRITMAMSAEKPAGVLRRSILLGCPLAATTIATKSHSASPLAQAWLQRISLRDKLLRCGDEALTKMVLKVAKWMVVWWVVLNVMFLVRCEVLFRAGLRGRFEDHG